MYTAYYDRDEAVGRFVIRPDHSLGWRGNHRFFLMAAAIAAATGAWLACLGAWPVLPFAGVEVLLLWSGLYVVARRAQLREELTITAEVIRVVWCRPGHATTRWEFPAPWARFELSAPRVDWYPSRLVLRLHDSSVELGAFLREQERQQLAGELEAARRELAGPKQ